jgi:hypothetical protein
MVSSKVMTNAAAHSHHSRRSMRRKLVRTTVVCPPVWAPTAWTTVFGCWDRNNHPLAPTFPRTLLRARAADQGAFCGLLLLPSLLARNSPCSARLPGAAPKQRVETPHDSHPKRRTEIGARRTVCHHGPEVSF